MDRLLIFRDTGSPAIRWDALLLVFVLTQNTTTDYGVRGEGDMVQRRWSWPGPNKRPVYNFRSEGREFSSNRYLIVADGFYEFSDPIDSKKKRKDKWLFTKKNEPIFCIARISGDTPEVGEAFTMLTMEPGPDIAPYHDRQIVILDRSDVGGLARPFGVGEVADQGPSTQHTAGRASRVT